MRFLGTAFYLACPTGNESGVVHPTMKSPTARQGMTDDASSKVGVVCDQQGC